MGAHWPPGYDDSGRTRAAKHIKKVAICAFIEKGHFLKEQIYKPILSNIIIFVLNLMKIYLALHEEVQSNILLLFPSCILSSIKFKSGNMKFGVWS